MQLCPPCGQRVCGAWPARARPLHLHRRSLAGTPLQAGHLQSRQQHRAPGSRGAPGHVCAAAGGPGKVRWRQTLRSTKFGVQEVAQALQRWLWGLPPVVALVRLLALVRQTLDPLLQPVRAVRRAVHSAQEAVGERFEGFWGEETKRSWAWYRQHEAEREYWLAILRYAGVVLATVTWQVITPVSFVLAFLLPMAFAYFQYNRWLLSPVAVATLAMSPLKFVPGGPFVWLI